MTFTLPTHHHPATPHRPIPLLHSHLTLHGHFLMPPGRPLPHCHRHLTPPYRSLALFHRYLTHLQWLQRLSIAL